MERDVQPMKNVPATLGEITKLEEKGRQQATDITLRCILMVEIIIRD